MAYWFMKIYLSQSQNRNMTSISELGGEPDHWIHAREEFTRTMKEMAVTMEDAVAMEIRFTCDGWCCSVYIYHPNNESLRAARKERLRLSAVSTPGTGDSFWYGIEPYAAI